MRLKGITDNGIRRLSKKYKKIFTIKDLITVLSSESQDALIGACFTDITGYANAIDGIKHAEDQHGNEIVVLDLSENTLTGSEDDEDAYELDFID